MESKVIANRPKHGEAAGSRGSYVDGPGLDCVAENDPKHIAEHEARISAHAMRIGGMCGGGIKVRGKIKSTRPVKSGCEFLDVNEVASRTGYTDSCVSKWRRLDNLPFVKDRNGVTFWYEVGALKEFFESRGKQCSL